MWNLSYGRVAADQLASAHAEAARDRMIAELPRPVGGRHPLRQALGEFLIRVGARLVMPSSPSTAR